MAKKTLTRQTPETIQSPVSTPVDTTTAPPADTPIAPTPVKTDPIPKPPTEAGITLAPDHAPETVKNNTVSTSAEDKNVTADAEKPAEEQSTDLEAARNPQALEIKIEREQLLKPHFLILKKKNGMFTEAEIASFEDVHPVGATVLSGICIAHGAPTPATGREHAVVRISPYTGGIIDIAIEQKKVEAEKQAEADKTAKSDELKD